MSSKLAKLTSRNNLNLKTDLLSNIKKMESNEVAEDVQKQEEAEPASPEKTQVKKENVEPGETSVQKNAEPVVEKPSKTSVQKTEKKESSKTTGTVKEEVPAKKGENTSTEKRKQKAFLLLKDEYKYLRIRASQLHIGREELLNNLIREEKERSSGVSPEERSDFLYNACENLKKGDKTRITITIDTDLVDYLAFETANAGITITDFGNYLLRNDIQRNK